MREGNLIVEHNRKSFVFYGSYLDAVLKLKDSQAKLELLLAIAFYGLDQKEPNFSNELASMAWVFIEPLLDANYQNYVNGGKGGAPIGNQNAKKTTQNNRKTTQNNPKQGNDNVNANDNANVNVKGKDNVNVNANDNANVNDNENINKEINTDFTDEDDGCIPYQDANGNWITSGKEDHV